MNSRVPELNPLLRGANFYKKFNNSSKLLTELPSFNPLGADALPPEACGYGIREFRLSNNLK